MQRSEIKKYGKVAGYIITALLFSIGLFIILSLARKIPVGWGYFHILGIVILIIILGFSIKKILS